MSNSVLTFVKHFIEDESGQAQSEYASAIAYAAVAFVTALVVFIGVQTGFVTIMGNAISGGLNKMAYNSANNIH
jgi:Flp pilus assembly pilin Flp